ncbi:hypothetical protein M2244_002783 [Rhodoferax antarcticus]|uniref:Uncharacterized protein n=1 Tax=Rhodoferax antarcticus ANT.BR TaxID=1111071 RepID=A0A1Q8YAW4_9BURK|nr:hypothetical protein [Rhodoferax antarcticus]OLP05188.1 hypothetical protein BLL52_3312 [Rhodoferax antarcticus ANT.BR]
MHLQLNLVDMSLSLVVSFSACPMLRLDDARVFRSFFIKDPVKVASRMPDTVVIRR